MIPRAAAGCGSLVGLLVAGMIGTAWGQPPPAPVPGGRQQLRTMSPQERQRVLEDFQRWNELPEARRQELQDAYQRFQRLPPDRREQIMNRFRQFQALPPEQQQRIIENQERWQRLPREEREDIRRRFKDMTPEERRQLEERLRQVPPAPDTPAGAQGFQGPPGGARRPPRGLQPGGPPPSPSR
jgi:hypothetical protein